jgi:hypothetical protein
MRVSTCLLFLALVLGFAAAAQASDHPTEPPQAPAAAEAIDAAPATPTAGELPDLATALGLQPEPSPQACEPTTLTFVEPHCHDGFCRRECRKAGFADGTADLAKICFCYCTC